MMFSSAGLPLLSLLLAASVSASPCVRRDTHRTLGFAHKLDITGSKNLAQIDRARAQALVAAAAGQPVSTSIKNAAVTYTSSIGVGSPPTYYTLLVDTGSSNTWIGADKAYVKTSSSKGTGNSVSVTYGSGSFSGLEYKDTVTLGSGLVVKNQYIGVADTSTGFSNVDGILGVGPTDLTQGTVKNMQQVNTVVDNLFKAKTIPSDELGIFFQPATKDGGAGELTWGGIDKTKISGTVHYAPITATSPASEYWGVKQIISYGNQTILPQTSGIVDTGTTLILLATDAFDKYKTLTGAVSDANTGLLRITSAQYSNLQDLRIKIGSQYYDMTPNAQIFPRSMNSQIGGGKNDIYLMVGDLGSVSGSGLDTILGYAFLERFYTVYDTAGKRVGFAPTIYTNSTSN